MPPSNDPLTRQEEVTEQESQERKEREDLYWCRQNANDDDVHSKSSMDEGYASRTPARQARVPKPAAVHFEPYKPSPQSMTPQDRQRIQDFEEYCMFCQIRETEALSTPTPFSMATSMSGSPPGGPPNTPSTRIGPVPRAFVKPRVGNVDKAGPWTGHGKGQTTCSPRTENCRRGFYGDQMKAMRQ